MGLTNRILVVMLTDKKEMLWYCYSCGIRILDL